MEMKNIKGIFSELKNMSFPTMGATKCQVQWIKIKLHSLGDFTTLGTMERPSCRAKMRISQIRKSIRIVSKIF